MERMVKPPRENDQALADDYRSFLTASHLQVIELTPPVVERAAGLVKKCAGKDKDVPFQMARTADALHERLRKVSRGDQIFVDTLLHCPDYTVREPGTAGIDPARIVDATRKDYLLQVIRGILPATGNVLPAKEKIQRFLSDILELVPEVHAVVGEGGALYTRLSGGLAHWARKIEFEPFRLRVIGTAGSGKTQLAMAVYRDAVRDGRRPLYVCYNRPLADHIALIAPKGGEIATYHQLRPVGDAHLFFVSVGEVSAACGLLSQKCVRPHFA
jgi:hypothetical protein